MREKKTRKITKKLRMKVLDLRLKYSTADTAKILDVSKTVVDSICNESNERIRISTYNKIERNWMKYRNEDSPADGDRTMTILEKQELIEEKIVPIIKELFLEGMHDKDVADILGVKKQALMYILEGKCNLRLKSIERIQKNYAHYKKTGKILVTLDDQEIALREILGAKIKSVTFNRKRKTWTLETSKGGFSLDILGDILRQFEDSKVKMLEEKIKLEQERLERLQSDLRELEGVE